MKGDSFLEVDEGDRAEGRGLIGGGDKPEARCLPLSESEESEMLT